MPDSTTCLSLIAAASATDVSLATFEAKVLINTLPLILDIISINESLTSDSDPDLPGIIELVESHTSKSISKLFNSLYFLSSNLPPTIGSLSIFQSPEWNIFKLGV